MGTKKPAVAVAGNANGTNAFKYPLQAEAFHRTAPDANATVTVDALVIDGRIVETACPLTVSVTLNARDAEIIEKMAEEEYRTPAQQVGYITSQWLKMRKNLGLDAQISQGTVAIGEGSLAMAAHNPPPGMRAGSVAEMNTALRADIAGAPGPAPATPQAMPVAPDVDLDTLIPVYHVGDGTAGSGCGKPGLLFTRELKGTVRPGDVRHLGGPSGCRVHGKAEGEAFGKGEPMSCCQCGGAMSPATWSYDADSEEAEVKAPQSKKMARMSNPGA